MKRVRIYPFFIPHAGCPHRCVFCDQARITGKDAGPDPSRVADELNAMLGRGGGEGEVAFYGGSFTLLDHGLQAAFLEAVYPFLEGGRISGIRLSTRPDALDAESVAFLVRYGVTTVEIGCQSFDSGVLARSGRGHDRHAAAGAVRRLRGAGIRIGLQLMPGLPGADREEALASLDTAIALGVDFLRIYPTVVFEGTALAELYSSGDYRPWTLDEAVAVCAELWRRCRRESMPVIRLGLQNSPELAQGRAILAGPWHPAFGQLVRSRSWLDRLRSVVGQNPGGFLDVHPADMSDVVGHKRENLTTLQQETGSLVIRSSADIPRGQARWQGQLLPSIDCPG